MLEFLVFEVIVTDGFLLVFPLILALLIYLGWKQRKNWARVLLICLVAVVVIALGLFVAYAWALGQANWSY